MFGPELSFSEPRQFLPATKFRDRVFYLHVMHSMAYFMYALLSGIFVLFGEHFPVEASWHAVGARWSTDFISFWRNYAIGKRTVQLQRCGPRNHLLDIASQTIQDATTGLKSKAGCITRSGTCISC